jgi:hypothetical protein
VRHFVAVCAVTLVTLVGALGTGPALAGDSRCDVLQEVVPATVGAIIGDLSGAARHARQLRDLSTRELVPARVKPALQKLARFFEDAPDLSLTERAGALQGVSRPLTKLVVYSTEVCGAVTTSTTLQLR